MKPKILIPSIVVVLLLVFGIQSMNKIPRLDEAVEAQWSQVLNQYKRRADLVPQLVEAVRGSANFEKSTLQSVIEARRVLTGINPTSETAKNPEELKKFQEAQQGLSSALSRLLVVVERYPEIKSTANFAALQSQLEGTENRISVARRDYIQAVQEYNATLRTFPGSMWNALVFHHEKRPNFTESEEVLKVPELKLG